MRRLAVLPLLLLALAGCGAGAQSSAQDFEGPQREVADTLEDLQKTAQAGNEQRVCTALLARQLVQRLQQQGTSCPRAVEAAFRDADSFEVNVRDVRVTGNTAVARITPSTAEDAPTDAVRLVREGANWKILSLGE